MSGVAEGMSGSDLHEYRGFLRIRRRRHGKVEVRRTATERGELRSIDAAVEGDPNGRWLRHDDPLWPAMLGRLDHDIYHHPAYLHAEARWLDGRPEAFVYAEGEASWFAPCILRRSRLPGMEASGPVLDAVSPYGYPGPVATAGMVCPGFSERAFAAFLAALRRRGAVSAFLRSHPCLDALPQVDDIPGLTERAWATVLIDLDADLDIVWSGVSRRRRQQIASAARAGMRARRQAFVDGLPSLRRIYDETMERVGVGGHERFTAAYFRALAPLAAHLDVWIVELQGVPVAATLVSRCGGLVQTLVGGTSTAALPHSPDRLLVWEVIAWAHSAGARAVHLGGGVGGRDDGVLCFKSSFGPGRTRFRTVRAVLDPDRYAALTKARAASLGVDVQTLEQTGYFPAYRAVPPGDARDAVTGVSTS